MNKYKIVSNFRNTYTIYERFLFFFWKVATFTESGKDGEYPSVELAINDIEKLKREGKVVWRG